jgi:hypothetical protein
MAEAPRNPLRFPPRRHVLSASLSIRDVPGVLEEMARKVAELLRESAADEQPAVAARLLAIADDFTAWAETEAAAAAKNRPRVEPFRRPPTAAE